MTFHDPELEAMNTISGVIQALDNEARTRVLRWVGDRYFKPSNAQNSNQSQQRDINLLPPQSRDLHQETQTVVESLADFIHLSIGDESFKKMSGKMQVVAIIKYLEDKSSSNTPVKTVDIKKELQQLGLNDSNLHTYLTRLKNNDRYIIGTNKDLKLTLKGRSAIDAFVNKEGQQVEIAQNTNEKNNEDALNVKSSKKTKKPKKPTSIPIDKELLKTLDQNSTTFTDFLNEYDPKKVKSAAAFTALSVYYVCEILNNEKATLTDIATCYKGSSRTAPDHLRQSVIDTANKNRFIFYTSPEDITLKSEGRKFLDAAKLEQ